MLNLNFVHNGDKLFVKSNNCPFMLELNTVRSKDSSVLYLKFSILLTSLVWSILRCCTNG